MARIVADGTDTIEGDTPKRKHPWAERKRRYLEHLRTVPAESLLVATCDKVHNLGTIVADVQADGVETLRRFRAGAPEQRKYFRAILTTVGPHVRRGCMPDLQSSSESLND